MQSSQDLIAAIATPPGRGGVGIVRLSGPSLAEFAARLCGFRPRPRHAHLADFLDAQGNSIDQGLILYFPAPASYTGEDVLELQGHGGPVILDMLLQRVIALGARPARPGEFSERAFLNDKLDLAQAEAVADLIDAGSAEAARAATRSLSGEFSRAVHALVEQLIELRIFVEAAIDFPDEEIDFLSDERVERQLSEITEAFDQLMQRAEQGRVMREGLRLVLAGRPNAGKSSLLNRLAGHDAAIVTDIPGTTRDVLREYVHLDGLPLHLIDTAGLREGGDAVEQEGIRRAREAMETADCVLLVVDDQSPEDIAELRRDLPPQLPVIIAHNKIDLSGGTAGYRDDQGRRIGLSALTGEGIQALSERLKAVAGYRPAGEDVFMARRRHLDAIERARAHVDAGQAELIESRAGELLAEELRLAQQTLGEISGEFSSDDLLGRIFSSFCIGK
ncbi:tRNA uridine-5-carboxymethylaminomethyl(34) synthesis GTPase MnmE [Gammaproteobacteria bacterium AB-CW1]|uniref:tRNA modification GTPase MnmE n=1 Tax=Natronospira elongata TaxID=3110268 RepID=A0AAP6JDJ9_9GAMM|nr:tRNA uridine-5-carboxymethylaminomethyl(34) synthesis GTPase MnmE [Gammaproteobacteria bacterium AB-CW1]